MKKILIVYYSRSGNTAKIARAIASSCNADTEEIHDVKKRTGFLGYWRSGREAWKEMLTEIKPVLSRPEDYDLIILGTPVWAGKISSPIRTYIENHHTHIKQVALFCTEGSSGGEEVMRQAAKLCGRQPLATLIVTESELKSGYYTNKIAEFLSQLRETIKPSTS